MPQHVVTAGATLRTHSARRVAPSGSRETLYTHKSWAQSVTRLTPELQYRLPDADADADADADPMRYDADTAISILFRFRLQIWSSR